MIDSAVEELVFLYCSLSAVLLLFPRNLFQYIYSSLNTDQERQMIILTVKKKNIQYF